MITLFSSQPSPANALFRTNTMTPFPTALKSVLWNVAAGIILAILPKLPTIPLLGVVVLPLAVFVVAFR